MTRSQHPHLSAALLAWLILATAAPQAVAFTSTPGTDGTSGESGAAKKDATTISAAHPTGQTYCSQAARGPAVTFPAGTTGTLDACSSVTIQSTDLGQTNPTAGAIPIAGTATNTTDPNYLLNPWVTHAIGDLPGTAVKTAAGGNVWITQTGTTTGTATSAQASAIVGVSNTTTSTATITGTGTTGAWAVFTGTTGIGNAPYTPENAATTLTAQGGNVWVTGTGTGTGTASSAALSTISGISNTSTNTGTGNLVGTGTANSVAKFTAAQTLAPSTITDNGASVATTEGLNLQSTSASPAPVVVGSVAVGTNPYSVYVAGRYAYTANYEASTISVVDVSNPAAPVVVGSVAVGTYPRSVYDAGR